MKDIPLAYWVVFGAFAVGLVNMGACSAPPDPLAAQRKAPTCADVCANYARLRCVAAKPTEAGDSCEAVCERVQGSGIVAFDLGCRAQAASCTAADACED